MCLSCCSYADRIRASYIWSELRAVRNVRPAFNTRLGLFGGMAYTALFYVLARGYEPWTLSFGGRYLIARMHNILELLYLSLHACLLSTRYMISSKLHSARCASLALTYST